MHNHAENDRSDAARHATSRAVGFVYDDVYLEHDTGFGHVERAERLEAVVQRLTDSGLLSRLVKIEPQPAPIESITTVHSQDYVDRVRQSCEGGAHYFDSMDTIVSEKSCEAALVAAGGVLAAVDAVMDGKAHSAFCAVRPPGHHALKDRAMGFCLFNNVAIAARYVQKKYELAKVLIVDWDVHHGNGTEATFYNDPSVFYFSVHQYPFYPGTGAEGDRGAGEGLGFTLNVPLSAGCGDAEYLEAFQKRLRPAALEFQPDFVLISAGFDAHEDDLLGGMRVTSDGFGRLTRVVKEIADACCQGRIVSVLEGGYELDGLAESIEVHLRALAE
jgi:acetoin utilization deacetylase AcuC-like enzyme